MTTVLNGLLGGLVVGGVATVVVRFVDDDPPATAAVLERVLGVRGPSPGWTAFAARVLYGGLAGASLLAVELYALRTLGVPPAAGEALAVAVAWSALLFVVVGLVRWKVLSRPADRPSLGELLAYHLVFGIGFGSWIRLTWIT